MVEGRQQFVLHWQVMWDEHDVQVAQPPVEETKQRYPQLAQCSFDKGLHSAANRRAREGTSRAGRQPGRECAQGVGIAAARAEGTHFRCLPRPKSPRKRSRKGPRARTDPSRTVTHSEKQGYCHKPLYNCADEPLQWRTHANPRAARVQDTLVECPVVRDQEVRRGDPRPQAVP